MNEFPADEIRSIATDPRALDRFYRTFIEDIRRFVARRVDDPHLAADLTADIFMAAIDGARGYRASKGVPRAWLFGIARTTVRSSWRRQGVRNRGAAKIAGRALVDEDDLERLERRIDAERAARAVYAELDRLPSTHRRLFELVAVDGWSIAEAAEAVGVSPDTAKVRMHRIRKRLRSSLDVATPLTEGA